MGKLGIVFSGGGGKGPYQIGVWRFLRETGLEREVGAVSGTSIGSLNAALFAAGDLDVVEGMWRQISPSDVLKPKKVTPVSLASFGTLAVGVLSAPLLAPLGLAGAAALIPLANASTLLFAKQGSVFTQKGIQNQIDAGIDPERLRTCPYPCYATCLRLGVPPQAERFDMRNYSMDDVSSILLASEAIPGVFQPVEFQGSKYCDGGFTKYGDNVPVQPVYDAGMRTILVIHLSDDEPTDAARYPGAEIYDLLPSRDLGGLVQGTMDFSAKGAVWRMDLGYEDAKAFFTPQLGHLFERLN